MWKTVFRAIPMQRREVRLLIAADVLAPNEGTVWTGEEVGTQGGRISTPESRRS